MYYKMPKRKQRGDQDSDYVPPGKAQSAAFSKMRNYPSSSLQPRPQKNQSKCYDCAAERLRKREEELNKVHSNIHRLVDELRYLTSKNHAELVVAKAYPPIDQQSTINRLLDLSKQITACHSKFDEIFGIRPTANHVPMVQVLYNNHPRHASSYNAQNYMPFHEESAFNA
jgi:hypothetical protein